RHVLGVDVAGAIGDRLDHSSIGVGVDPHAHHHPVICGDRIGQAHADAAGPRAAPAAGIHQRSLYIGGADIDRPTLILITTRAHCQLIAARIHVAEAVIAAGVARGAAPAVRHRRPADGPSGARVRHLTAEAQRADDRRQVQSEILTGCGGGLEDRLGHGPAVGRRVAPPRIRRPARELYNLVLDRDRALTVGAVVEALAPAAARSDQHPGATVTVVADRQLITVCGCWRRT